MTAMSILIDVARESGLWIVTAVLATQWSNVRRWLRFRTLRRAFGSNIRGAKDVFFSLPLWSVIPGDRGAPRYHTRQHRPKPRPDDALYGPSDTYAREDVLGAVRLSEELARFFRRPVDFISDDVEANWERKTGILIGTHTANRHAHEVMVDFTRQFPDDVPVEFVEIEENDETGARMMFRCKQTQEVFKSDDEFEYAVVLRLSNRFSEKKAGYIFVIGGIHAAGTYAAACCLANRWRRFARRKGPAAVILKMQRDRHQTARPVKSYNVDIA